MKYCYILLFIAASVQANAQMAARQWGVSVNSGYTQRLGAYNSRGSWAWGAGIVAEERRSALLSLGVALKYLNIGYKNEPNMLQWPSEFDPATGQYVRDPSLPHSSYYQYIYHCIALPVEVKCAVIPHGKFYFIGEAGPLLSISRVTNFVLHYDDGHTMNTSSKQEKGGLGIGLSIGAGYSFPLGARWRADLRPGLRLLSPHLVRHTSDRFSEIGIQLLFMRQR